MLAATSANFLTWVVNSERVRLAACGWSGARVPAIDQPMSKRWRSVALIGLSLLTWLGCSSDDGEDLLMGHAGPSAAGNADAGGADTGSGAGTGSGGSAHAGARGLPSTAGVGGTAPSAGSPGALGGQSGGGGASSTPPGWTCIPFTYGDGQCDCGCGVPDKDCADAELARCDVCNAVGSCSAGACPGRIDPEDVTACVSPPARWSCDPATYGDGTCNCGCGVVDVDCPDAMAASCELCDQSSCWPLHCSELIADDNAHCQSPPPAWNCSARLYRDGVRCDCGCGALDPDCESAGVEACDKCDSPGSCSAHACPGVIDPTSNGVCEQPPAPPGWQCPPGAYADGIECDCGCGVEDLDCRDAAFDTCVRCLVCGGHGACEDTVDPADTTRCAAPPSGWICSADAFRDSICDCGCGIADVFCQGIELSYVCGNYPVEGCSAGNKSHIDPNHNAQCIVNVPDAWTCDRRYYDDGFCDCGCAVVDPDCPSDDVSACEQCDGDGSCGTEPCPGTIDPTDTAQCAGP